MNNNNNNNNNNKSNESRDLEELTEMPKGLKRLSPEELKKGKKYFVLLKKVLFLSMLIVLAYFFRSNYLFLLAN